MPPIAIILNTTSGKGTGEELEKLITLPENEVFNVFRFEPENIKQSISSLYSKGYRTIISAGGDGTVSSIAGAIVDSGHEIRLGVLPVGTLNHFSKDIGMPSDLVDSLEIIKKGKSRQIDIARVNDTFFINNSSLGIYPQIVKEREQKRVRAFSKTLALVSATIDVLRSENSVILEFEAEKKKVRRKTPFVFVGNNKYAVSGLAIGERKKLDEGILFICMTKKLSIIRAIMLGIKALLGNILKEEDFNVIGLRSLTISSQAKALDVSHDGEVTKMCPPLNYTILPKALSVIIP